MKKEFESENVNIFFENYSRIDNAKKKYLFLGISIIFVTFLIFLRKPDSFYNAQFWAEDGLVFFSQAHHLGLKSLFTNYAGYYHTLVRIIALLFNYIPLRFVTYFYNYSSLLIIYFILIYLYSDRIKISLNNKIIMSSLLITAPLSSEVFMNLANSITTISILFLLLIISGEPVSKGEKIFDILLLIIVGLSTIYIVLVLPIFLIQLFFRKTKHFKLLTIIAVILTPIQVINFIYNRIINAHSDESMIIIFKKAIQNFYKWIIFEADIKSKLFFIGFIIILVIYIFLLFYLIKNKKNNHLIILTFGLVVLFAVLIFKTLEIRGMSKELEGRYQFVPIITFLWTLVFLRKENKFFSSLFFIFFIANIISFLLIVTVFKSPPLIDYNWKSQSKSIYNENFSVVPINPNGWYILMQSKKDIESTGLRSNYTNIELLKKELTKYAGAFNIGEPTNIICDSNNNIYFINNVNEQILKYDPGLDVITNWPKYDSNFNGFNNLQSIAIDSLDKIYIVDIKKGKAVLSKYDLDGKLLEKPMQMAKTEPTDFGIDSMGNIFLVDPFKDCIKKYNKKFELVKKIGLNGENSGQFNDPLGLVLDKNDNVYVSDTKNNRIQKFDSKLNFLKEWGTSGNQNGEFDYPAGIFIDSKNKLYIADQNNHRMQVFDLEGNYLSQVVINDKNNKYPFTPADITDDKKNNYFLTDFINNKVYKVDINFKIINIYSHVSYIILD